MIRIIPVKKEELLDYIKLLEDLYDANYSYWILEHFFDKIVPDLNVRIKDIESLNHAQGFLNIFLRIILYKR